MDGVQGRLLDQRLETFKKHMFLIMFSGGIMDDKDFNC